MKMNELQKQIEIESNRDPIDVDKLNQLTAQFDEEQKIAEIVRHRAWVVQHCAIVFAAVFMHEGEDAFLEAVYSTRGQARTVHSNKHGLTEEDEAMLQEHGDDLRAQMMPFIRHHVEQAGGKLPDYAAVN